MMNSLHILEIYFLIMVNKVNIDFPGTCGILQISWHGGKIVVNLIMSTQSYFQYFAFKKLLSSKEYHNKDFPANILKIISIE